MFQRRSYDQQVEDEVHVSCFSFGRKKSKNAALARGGHLTDLPPGLFVAPSSSDLSVASCSLSSIGAVHEVSPLHLDIPFVAASPQSHSNTLASIERFDTPRASNYGPVSEAGKARVAARKHSMRQEHLAAIAKLNTFAKKRSSKPPYSASGSDSGSCQSASRHSTPVAASVSSQHHQQLPGSRQRPPSVTVNNSPHVHGEPGWSDEPVLANAMSVSGSVRGASDWYQDDSGQNQSACQVPSIDPVSSGGPASLDMPGQPNISTTADDLQGQPLVHAANLSSVPLLAQDSSLGASTSSSCADSADFQSSKAPKAAAACSRCDSLSSSQQDSSSPMHSNTSASSFYTKAGSMSSKACSSPVRHNSAVSKSQMLGTVGPAHSALEPGPTTASQLLHQPSSQVEPSRQPAAAAYKEEAAQNDAETIAAQHKGNPVWAQLRQDDAQASLASRESSPDESLIAEGWIVAGTIMSNRDYRSDGENAVPNVSSAASMASAAVPQKATPSQSSSTASAALSDDELAQLTQELSVLSEQPRSQMTPQQIGRYLDIRIRLGRAGSVASVGRHQAEAAVQAVKTAVKEVATPTRPSPTAPTAGQHSNSRAKPDSSIAASRPRKAAGKTTELPASRQKRPPEKRGGENSAGGYVPAYMKATASVKAKDAHDQQAQIAAARSALSEKKWNRA
ncbi:TPA: hypothetical protein ACH3X1_015059 [Trebouxia sp. C0004]